MSYISFIGGKFIETTGGKSTTFSDGHIIFNATKPINIKGDDKGVTLEKPKKFIPKTDLKITKIEGPFDEKGNLIKVISNNVFYTYKATPSRIPTEAEVKLLRWAVKHDDGKINQLGGVASFNELKEGKIIIGIVIHSECEKARVYAYYEKAIKDISVEVKLGPLQYIIVIGTQNHRGDTSFNPITWRDVGPGSKLMFAHQALRRMRLNKDIKFAVFMCEDGYKPSHIKAVKDSVTNLHNGKFHQVSSVQQIINYLNTGDIDNSAGILEERKIKPVKQLFFYSHGLVGKIALGMSIMEDNSDYAFGKEQVAKLNKEAFTSESHIYSFACRTGLGNPDIDKTVKKEQTKNSGIITTPVGPIPIFKTETIHLPLYSAQSIAQKLSDQTGATTYAYLRRSDYEDTLSTLDELAFSDYMKTRKKYENVTLSPKRYGDKYKYLLDEKYKLTNEEDLRWREWEKIDSNYKNIDDAWFDPDGARHNVKAAKTPEGVPAEMQTFKPLKK